MYSSKDIEMNKFVRAFLTIHLLSARDNRMFFENQDLLDKQPNLEHNWRIQDETNLNDLGEEIYTLFKGATCLILNESELSGKISLANNKDRNTTFDEFRKQI